MNRLLHTLLIIVLVAISPNPVQANENADPGMDIWTAAALGDSKTVQLHLAAGTDIDGTDQAGGSSPLIVASLFGQVRVARLLLDKGANLDQGNRDGATALHVAAFFGQPKIVSLLLERGADFRIRNNFGQTAFEGVSGKWSSELENIYKMVGAMWEIPLDLDHIKEVRPKIADLIGQHVDRQN